MESNYAIVDLQGFKNNSNKFIVKEIAILTKNIKFHDIIKPPSPISELDYTHQKQVKWLTRNYHGIEWNDGFTTFRELQSTIEHILNGKIIYVKGAEKIIWLRRILGNKRNTFEIVDLESKNCSISLHKKNKSSTHMKFHICSKHKALQNNSFCWCALQHVLILRNWCQVNLLL